MDLNDYWQENKRFLVTVASGALLFGIGSMMIGSWFGDELDRQRRTVASTRGKLTRDAMYTSSDLAAAQDENEALVRTVATLTQASAFAPRPQFLLDPKRGSASNQYFAIVAAVREDLLRQAGRANMRVPEDLGLPALSPTREPDIARYMEALDLVDRVMRMALVAGCERIDKIEIRLDPRLSSREGVGRVETTRVGFTLSGRGAPLVQLLLHSQQTGAEDPDGVPLLGPLLIEKAEMVPARSGSEASLDVTFQCARIGASEPRPGQP